jgi:hypothetical protein
LTLFEDFSDTCWTRVGHFSDTFRTLGRHGLDTCWTFVFAFVDRICVLFLVVVNICS